MNKTWKSVKAAGIVIFCLAVLFFIYGVFFSEWGEKGWSEGANISIDDSGIVKIGTIDDTSVYTYDLSEVYFLHISAKGMGLDEFIKQDWVDTENLFNGEKDTFTANGQRVDVYMNEAYKVIHTGGIIIYAPVKADESKLIDEAINTQ